jgi:hypothetical protein
VIEGRRQQLSDEFCAVSQISRLNSTSTTTTLGFFGFEAGCQEDYRLPIADCHSRAAVRAPARLTHSLFFFAFYEQ